jgi:hypothetical protein
MDRVESHWVASIRAIRSSGHGLHFGKWSWDTPVLTTCPPRIGDLLVQHSPLRKCREIFVGREKKNGKARPGIAHPRARILMCGLTWQGGSIRRNTGTRTIGCRNKLGLPALKN